MSGKLVFDRYPLQRGTLAPGWALVSIGQIAKIVASGFPSGQHNQEGKGVPHIRPMNIDREGRLDLRYLKYVEGEIPRELARGDVLFNNTNSPELIGKTTAVLIDTRLAYSNHMTRVRLEDGLNPSFIARQLHFLWMCGYFRHRCVNHVNQASISADPLSETVPILLPPVREQERIADAMDELLSDLDAGVAALERVRTKLKLYRAALLKTAVEGALTADWRKQHPQTEPGSELLKRILAERRRRWEAEQLRKFKDKGSEPPKNWKMKYNEPVSPDLADLSPLPEGWCWTSLGQAFSVHVGATPSREKKAYWNGNIPWVASGEVQFCRILETRERITAEGLANTSTQLNPAGSVILNMIGEGKTRGKAGILEVAACNNQNCAAIWVSDTPISAQFVYFWLLYRYEQTRQLGSGNNQPAMNKSIVEQIEFPLPPLAEQEAIVEAAEDQLSVIDHLEADLDAKLTNAQALRQSILRHAFSGKLVPPDPKDEPASELLKRIATEREQRARDAAAKRLNGQKLRRIERRGRPRMAKNKKETEHGRIADR